MRNVFKESILLLLSTTLALIVPRTMRAADPYGTTVTWAAAEMKWQAYAEKNCEGAVVRGGHSKVDRSACGCFVEITSEAMATYMPSYRLRTDYRQLFALHISGEILPLGGGSWTDIGENPPLFRNSAYSAFIVGQRIRLQDKSSAIGLVRLSDEILSAPRILAAVRDLTSGYRVFDIGALGQTLAVDQQWAYSAKKLDNVWFVSKSFVGPVGASITAPPVWELVTDDEGRVLEMRQRREPM